MAYAMRSHMAVRERGALSRCPLDGETQPRGHRGARQTPARGAGKERPIGSTVNPWQPAPQLRRRGLPQRYAAILASFAMEVHAGAPVQDDIGHAEACEFGDSGTGVVQRREHDPIPLSAQDRKSTRLN